MKHKLPIFGFGFFVSICFGLALNDFVSSTLGWVMASLIVYAIFTIIEARKPNVFN